MRTGLATLSNHLYQASRERLCDSARKLGIDDIYSFDFEEIKQTKFYIDNEEILSNSKFLGYWLWKPYIIADTLNKLDEGDVLIYADAGIEIISHLDWLVEHCRQSEPIMIFGNANDTNSVWTKRDCFVMMECDTAEFWHGPHCDASLVIFRKCPESIQFVNLWLEYGRNKYILTDLPNISGLPNISNYRDHRYDQSILSLLAQKLKINLYRIPSQFGNHYKIYNFRIKEEFNCVSQWDQSQVGYYSSIPYYNSFYGQLLNHHRTKKINDISAVRIMEHKSIKQKILNKIKQIFA